MLQILCYLYMTPGGHLELWRCVPGAEFNYEESFYKWCVYDEGGVDGCDFGRYYADYDPSKVPLELLDMWVE